MKLTGKQQQEKVHKMKLFSRLKFLFYYNTYIILNDAAIRCYGKYWKILNDQDKKEGGIQNGN